MRRGRFLFLEPFFGGSHREFAEGLVAHSRHEIELHTLPARFWKWRLRGAALYLAGRLPAPRGYDGLITTGLLSLSDLKALWGEACPPALVYFHENQLTYPLAPGERMDYQFGFTDITTALAADRVLFNSRSHYDAFFAQLPAFLRRMPEYRPRWVIEAIRGRSGVLYPGCRFAPSDPIPLAPPGQVPLVIWNHRWEFDKDPGAFFAALEEAAGRGARFELALLGENYQKVPKAFLRARERWGAGIAQYGYVEERREYRRWLERGAVVISTARQENFGIAVVEAVRRGCAPLLPGRLSYPELIPPAFHDDFLYADHAELVDKLVRLLTELPLPESPWGGKVRALAECMNRYAWDGLIGIYDAELDRLAGFTA
ncbi:MAG: DUF3524 domain-containing protein [Spirochaetales bacterium]|nr:DUF3524 domain-containing protein [Spirochaetales bacterium]